MNRWQNDDPPIDPAPAHLAGHMPAFRHSPHWSGVRHTSGHTPDHTAAPTPDGADCQPLDTAEHLRAIHGLLWGLLLAVPLWLVILLVMAGTAWGYALGVGWR